jgi:prepilin-type N-terminal cleavage/methylation domain-containing protein
MLREPRVLSLRDRRAFTLVEMLVVIGVISVLASLVLVGVMQAQATARRLSCQNNLKQLYLAATLFETSKSNLPAARSFMNVAMPPGYVKPANFNASNANQHAVTWVHEILPYIEQQGLHELLQSTLVSFTTGNPNGLTNPVEDIVRLQGNSGIRLSLLLCPSDERDGTKEQMSYAANGGLPDNVRIQGIQLVYSFDWPANGVFDNRLKGTGDASLNVHATTLGDIKDGLTNTIMFGENVDVQQWHLNGWSPSGAPASQNGELEFNACIVWQDDTVTQRLNKDTDTGNGFSAAYARPSSNHPSGFNVVMCGGQVKLLSESISYDVYRKLMSSNGKKYKSAGQNTSVAATLQVQSSVLDEDSYSRAVAQRSALGPQTAESAIVLGTLTGSR